MDLETPTQAEQPAKASREESVTVRRRALAGITAVLIAWSFLVPAKNARWAAYAAAPIKVAEVGPLSPPGNYGEGILMKQAAEIATDEINAQGGVLGRPIAISYQDTRAMPEEGKAVADRVITQEHVAAIFGEYHGAPFLAEMDIAHKYGIPIVAVDIWIDSIVEAGYPEVFRVAPSFGLISKRWTDWMVAAGFKNVALLVEKTDYGINAKKNILPVLRARGIRYDVVDADLATVEFTAAIERLKHHAPRYDFFYTAFGGTPGVYSLVTQANSLGLAPTVRTGMGNSGGAILSPTFWKNVRGAGAYLVTESVALPRNAWNAKTRAFAAKFIQRFHAPPSPAAFESYDAEWIIAEAIKRAGTTNPKALIAALERTDWVGTRGRYTFSTGHNPSWAYHSALTAPVQLIQFDRVDQSPDSAPIIWPRSLATVKYLYLRPRQ